MIMADYFSPPTIRELETTRSPATIQSGFFCF